MPGSRRAVDRGPIPLDSGLDAGLDSGLDSGLDAGLDSGPAGGFVVRPVHAPGAETVEFKACERRRLRGVPGDDVHTAMPAGQATPVPPWPQ